MNDLIYNQNLIPKDQYRYGFRASKDTGCGWVAVHNALCLLGKKTNIEELIRYFCGDCCACLRICSFFNIV